MDSIPELQYSTPLLKRVRTREAMLLAMAIKYSTNEMVVLRASRLLEIDEQLNPSKDEPMTWKRPRCYCGDPKCILNHRVKGETN